MNYFPTYEDRRIRRERIILVVIGIVIGVISTLLILGVI